MRPRKTIPITDIKGLETLVLEGKTQAEIAEHFGVDRVTIGRRIKEIEKDDRMFKYLITHDNGDVVEVNAARCQVMDSVYILKGVESDTREEMTIPLCKVKSIRCLAIGEDDGTKMFI